MSPKDGVFLNYVNYGGDKINIVNFDAGGNNIAATTSGVYDFILAYANTNLLDRLPVMAASWHGPFTFDGLSTGATPATRPFIGSQATNSSPRKDAVTGEPNTGYVNNMDAKVLKYMIESMGITKITETNIIGNASDLPGTPGNVSLHDVNTINVGFIMDFSSITALTVNTKGVMDIKGPAPEHIAKFINPKSGYLNLYDDISRETYISTFFVVRVHGNGGEYILYSHDLFDSDRLIVNQVVFEKKYTASLVGGAAVLYNWPYYRVFLDGTAGNVPKVAGSGAEGFTDPRYASAVNNMPLYPMDEGTWITAARAGGMAGADAAPLAANLTALGAGYKWGSEAELIANAVN